MPLSPTAPTARDPFALADACEDAVAERRTAHWVRPTASAPAVLHDCDPRCSHCGGPFGPGSEDDRCAECVSPVAARDAGGGEGGLRAGAAGMLGLCEECGENVEACECESDDDCDDAELAADRILERQELEALDDAYPWEDDAYEGDYAEAE